MFLKFDKLSGFVFSNPPFSLTMFAASLFMLYRVNQVTRLQAGSQYTAIEAKVCDRVNLVRAVKDKYGDVCDSDNIGGMHVYGHRKDLSEKIAHEFF